MLNAINATRQVMGEFIHVAMIDEIPPRSGKVITVGQREIALFRMGEEILAIDNVCPHAGGSLGAGTCKKGVVYCPIHLWGFELKTGACDTVSDMRADVFETRVTGGKVFVCPEPKPIPH
jgi:nitrite reductase/ring-hydroxylating ferredoxin subunit